MGNLKECLNNIQAFQKKVMLTIKMILSLTQTLLNESDEEMATIIKKQCPGWATSQTHNLVNFANPMFYTITKEEKEREVKSKGKVNKSWVYN